LIDAFVDGLKAKGFELIKEGSFSEFLGIKFEEDTLAGSITMTQTGLIKKIITTTKMENCNPNWVPAAKEALGIDPEGEPMEEDWSYPSVVGQECCCISRPTRDPTLLSPSVKWRASIITRRSCMQPQSR
jgi:hypothetical protein